jgi:glycosyltransferase involved in cell wall biosynthesis
MNLLKTISLGSRGPEVQKLQNYLNFLGENLSVNGIFDKKTQSAVLRFQQKMRVGQIDGVCTQSTWNLLINSSRIPYDMMFGVGADDPAPKEETPAGPVDAPTTVHPMVQTSRFEWEKDPGFQVVMAVKNCTDTIDRAIESIEAAMIGKRWVICIVDGMSEDGTWDKVSQKKFDAEAVICERKETKNVAHARNTALMMMRGYATQFPAVLIMDGDDVMTEERPNMLKLAVELGTKAVVGSYYQFDQATGMPLISEASETTQVVGNFGAWATLFHASLVPQNGILFDESINIGSDSVLWAEWFKKGIMMPGYKPVVHRYFPKVGGANWPTLNDVREDGFKKRVKARRAAVEASNSRPLISALLLTGRCPERYPLARVAIDCFIKQTWPNKELVIINHGKTKLSNGDPRIVEIFTEKGPGVTLGDLRNMSIEAAMGEWCIQWDDDDWHHPTRMETQLKVAKKDGLSTFDWQIRCNLYDGSAFYDFMPGGQHMSILFHRSVPQRYEKLEVREDTIFKSSFSEVASIANSITNPDCDPSQYIRFFHGRNIWDKKHIMRGSMARYEPVPGKADLLDYHADLLDDVIHQYYSQPDFTLPNV